MATPRASHQPTSNIRLALYGVLLGLLPLLYPHLLSILPSAISSHLPFQSASVSPSHHWSAYQRLQDGSPRAANHDPFDLKGPEAERQKRFASKDGEREREKEDSRARRAVEVRAQSAGAENNLQSLLPVYFIEQGKSLGLRCGCDSGRALTAVFLRVAASTLAGIVSNAAPVAADSDFGKALTAAGKEIAQQLVPKRVILLSNIK